MSLRGGTSGPAAACLRPARCCGNAAELEALNDASVTFMTSCMVDKDNKG